MSETATLSLWECIKTSAWVKRNLLVTNRGCTSFWMFAKVSFENRDGFNHGVYHVSIFNYEGPGDVCD